jgi:hypothetical protein
MNPQQPGQTQIRRQQPRFHVVGEGAKRPPNTLSRGMLDDVLESFLDDAIGGQFDLWRQPLGQLILADVDIQARAWQRHSPSRLRILTLHAEVSH